MHFIAKGILTGSSKWVEGKIPEKKNTIQEKLETISTLVTTVEGNIILLFLKKQHKRGETQREGKILWTFMTPYN